MRLMLTPGISLSETATRSPLASVKTGFFDGSASFHERRSASHPTSRSAVVRLPGECSNSSLLTRRSSGRVAGLSKSPASAFLTDRERAQLRSQRTVRPSASPAIWEISPNCSFGLVQSWLSKRRRSTQRHSLPSMGGRKSACHQRTSGRSESRWEKTTFWRERAASPASWKEICSLQTSPPLAPLT